MAKGDCGPLEGTLIALQDSEKHLRALLHRQDRVIEATGRPDPALAKKLAFWKYTCESLRDQLDHEMLIRPAIEGERAARQRKEAAKAAAEAAAERRAETAAERHALILEAAERLEFDHEDHEIASILARKEWNGRRLSRRQISRILTAAGFRR